MQTDPPTSVQLSAGKFDTKNGSDSAGLTKAFTETAAREPRSFVIYFHGGLVSRESALASASRLSLEYKKAGAESMFVIWETAPKEVVGQNIQRIFDEPIFRSLLGRVTEFVRGKLEKVLGEEGSRAISKLPRTLRSEIGGELEKGKRGEKIFAEFEIKDLPSPMVPTPVDPQRCLNKSRELGISQVLSSLYVVSTVSDCGDNFVLMIPRQLRNTRACHRFTGVLRLFCS